MANSPRQAGKESKIKRGWWLSNRFLFWRRLSQLAILMMFLSGSLFNFSILKGNYSGSLLFDMIPMSDPLIILESLSTLYIPAFTALLGFIIVVIFYSVVGSKIFCGWVCPLNLITDFAAWLRRKLGIRKTAKLPRSIRYAMLLIILFGSAVSGTLLWEWINPVATLGRILIYGIESSLWLILAIFLLDLLIIEHGWCGHLCPLGACYALIGAKSIVRISAKNRKQCNNCMDCYHICPEPQVLRFPLHGKNNESPLVLSKDCISCGRCIDVCAENVFSFTTRFNHSGGSK